MKEGEAKRLAKRLATYLGIQAAVGTAFLLAGEHAATTFPLDDAYIHHVYAEGIAYGEGLSYNPGTPAAGSTSPLWAVVLSLFHLVGIGASVLGTKILGLLLGGVSALLADRLAARIDERIAWVAGVLVALDPALAFGAVSGMEVPLACALLLAGLVLLERPRAAGIALAAAVATRPELTLVAVLVVAMAWRRKRTGLGWLAAPTVVVWVAWCAWNLHASNALLPTTFYAKHGALGPFAQWRDLPFAYLATLGGPVLAVAGLPFVVLGLRHWRKEDESSFTKRLPLLLVAIAFLLPLALTWAHDLRELDFYWSRYALPLRPIVLVIVAVGVGSLAKGRNAALAFLALGVLAAGLLDAREHAENCRNVYELDVRAAEWVREHSVDADWIAANDAGAMRVIGQRRVVDLVGLNDHRMLGPDKEAVLDETRPRYFVVFRSWFPRLSERYPVATSFRSEPYTICSNCDQDELLVLQAR